MSNDNPLSTTAKYYDKTITSGGRISITNQMNQGEKIID